MIYMIIFIGCVILVTFTVFMVIFLVNRNCDYASGLTDQRISAKQFFALYSIAPERWTFNEFGFVATYRRDVVKQNAIFCCGDGKYGDIIYGVEEHITFKSYRDALRVRHYFRMKEKRRDNAKIMKHRADLLMAWQKDINEFIDKNSKIILTEVNLNDNC